MIYTDGECRGNGTANQDAYSVIMKSGVITRYRIGHKTSNESELQALMMALSEAEEKEEILSDSKLSVQMIKGNWKCKKEHLKPLVIACQELKRLKKLRINWIPREENLAGIWIERNL